MHLSDDLVNFFKDFSNKAAAQPISEYPSHKSTKTFAEIEKNCSNIDQNLIQIRKDLTEISKNMDTTFGVSSDCHYKAACTYVSLQTLAEQTAKPTFVTRFINGIHNIYLFISNMIFSIYH